MDKKEFLERIARWGRNGEYNKIISAVLALPESSVDDEIMQQLAMAYNCTGEFKKAIAVLEGLRERKENSWQWQYCMGFALLNVKDDDECEDDEALRDNILERARTCFSRCMVLQPPEDCLEECDEFLQIIEDEIFGDEDIPEDDNGGDFYDDDDADALEEHIKKHFGDFPSVYRELFAPDVYIDVCVVPPSEQRNYYTLITFGMGSRQMDIPEEYSGQPSRVELFLRLPAEWKVGESDEEWCWPIILLKNIGRLPAACDTWIGRGHTVDNHETFAINTRLSASIVLDPEELPEQARICSLPSGESVKFFEVVPLYREEMLFKIDNSADELTERLKSAGCSRIVDISRPSAVPMDYTPQSDLFWESIYDRITPHYESIIEKALPLNPIAAANHIAIFLRWCIESGFCSEELTERFPELVQEVLNGNIIDLRGFIINRFDGALFRTLIANEYRDFADWYYQFGEVGFPHDVDMCAEEYFGTERYNSEEFKDEAYLFMPFDEEVYRRLASKITQKYQQYALAFSARDNAEIMRHTMQNAFGRLCRVYDIFIDGEDCEQDSMPFQNNCNKQFTPFYAISANELYDNNDPAVWTFLSGELAADSLEQAAAKMTAGFERDNFEIPQDVLDKAKDFSEKFHAEPIIIPCDCYQSERLFIPSENGYYSVSRPACALLRCGELRDLLLSRNSTGERLYRPNYYLQSTLGCPCIELGRLSIQAALQIYECAQQCAVAGAKPVLAIIADKRAGSAAAQLDAAFSQPPEFALIDLPVDWENSDYIHRSVREEMPLIQSEKAKRFETEYGIKPLVIVQNGNTSDTTIMLPKGSGYSVIRKLDDYLYGTLDALSGTLSELLGCEVSILGTIRGESEFHKAYEKALSDGKRNNYIPLLIKASPDFALSLTSAKHCDDTDNTEIAYRDFCKKVEERLGESDARGDIVQNVPLTKFITCKSEQGGWAPVLCAKLPTNGALSILARLGVFGCHDTAALSAAEKAWQKYGALPALLGTNTLEFYVSNPAQKGDEKMLAAQMLTQCEGLGAVGGFRELAGSLPNSKVWFFCW